MNTTAIYIKTQPEVKSNAQAVARAMGLSLSALVNGWLKQLAKNKTVTFSATDEVPNAKLRRALLQSEKNWKSGKHSPAFKTGEEAVAWLEKQGI